MPIAIKQIDTSNFVTLTSFNALSGTVTALGNNLANNYYETADVDNIALGLVTKTPASRNHGYANRIFADSNDSYSSAALEIVNDENYVGYGPSLFRVGATDGSTYVNPAFEINNNNEVTIYPAAALVGGFNASSSCYIGAPFENLFTVNPSITLSTNSTSSWLARIVMAGGSAAQTPLAVKAINNASYYEPILETPAALRISSTFSGTSNQFRLLPFQGSIYFQNTNTAGGIYFGGENSTAITNNTIGFQAGSGAGVFIGPSGGTATAKLNVVGTNAASSVVVLKGAASMTTDLMQLRDSNDNVLMAFNRFGDLAFKGTYPGGHTDSTYPAIWLGGSNCSLMAEPASSYRCVLLAANRLRASGAWGQPDPTRNTWTLQLGYESNINGLQIVRSPAGNANTYENWFTVDNATGTRAISNSSSVAALSAIAASGQSTNIFEVKSSSLVNLMTVSSAGIVDINAPKNRFFIRFNELSNTTSWGIALGNETTAALYIGGTGSVTTQYFWRGDWDTASTPCNTFRTASGSASKVVVAFDGGVSQSVDILQIRDSSGSVLAAFASNGRLQMATIAGTPTGTPANGTSVYDTSTNKLWVYNGAWRSVTLA